MSQVQSPETPNLKIVDRMVSEVPLVKTAKELVEDGYDRVRKMNNLTETTFGLAEKSFYMWATAAKPLVSMLQAPITYADNLACEGLEKLEKVVPAIQKKPEELIGDAKKYTTTTVQSVKDYGMNRINPYLNVADQALNNAIDFANRVLPEAEGEKIPEDANSLVRFKAFSNKLQVMIAKQARDTFAMVELPQDLGSSIGKLTVTSIEVSNKLATELAEKVRKEAMALGEGGKWLWGEVSKDETEEEKRGSPIKRTGLRVLKGEIMLAKYFQGKLPEPLQQQIEHGTKYAEHLYGELRKAENVRDVYVVATTEIHTGVDVVRGWIITHVPLANRLLNKEIEAA